MKRSFINNTIRDAIEFFDSCQFRLPPFAFYTPEEWREQAGSAAEIFDLGLGWDVTGFGLSDFNSTGLLLFTLRNGGGNYPKPYAEKVMMIRENQVTPCHFHWHKVEDIIVRGGGNLVIELFRANPAQSELTGGRFVIQVNGMRRTMNSGDKLILTPGESVCLEPVHAHRFYAEPGSGNVLAGEVSMVNDDNCDNCFLDRVERFDSVEEDVPAEFLLAKEYCRLFGEEACHA